MNRDRAGWIVAGAIAAVCMFGAGSMVARNAADNGRFQIVISDLVVRDRYLLDTQTGEVWLGVTVVDGEGNASAQAWEKMFRIDVADMPEKWGVMPDPALPAAGK